MPYDSASGKSQKEFILQYLQGCPSDSLGCETDFDVALGLVEYTISSADNYVSGQPSTLGEYGLFGSAEAICSLPDQMYLTDTFEAQ